MQSVPKRTNVYRRVSRSWVDETLFGNTTTKKSDDPPQYRVHQKDTVRIVKPRTIARDRKAAPSKENAITVSIGDLKKIHQMSVIETPAMLYAQKMAALEQREKVQKKALARKERILALEEARNRNRMLSDIEKEEIQTRNGFLKRANDLLAQQHDAVKEMNQMV